MWHVYDVKPSKPKPSLLYKYTSERNLRSLCPAKLFPNLPPHHVEWQTLKDMFVGITHWLQNGVIFIKERTFSQNGKCNPNAPKTFSLWHWSLPAQIKMDINYNTMTPWKDAFTQVLRRSVWNFSAIASFAKKILTAYDSIYAREQTFSATKFQKVNFVLEVLINSAYCHAFL